MGALVVAVLVGGLTWLGVAVGHRRSGVLESQGLPSVGGCLFLYALTTLGPVLVYQGVALFARRLHVELDSQCFRASFVPLPPWRAPTSEATAAIERFDVAAAYRRDDTEYARWRPGAARDGFRLVVRLRTPATRPWAVRFDDRAQALFLAERLNAELATIAAQSVDARRRRSGDADAALSAHGGPRRTSSS